MGAHSTLFFSALLVSPAVFAQTTFLWDQVLPHRKIALPHIHYCLQLAPSADLDWVTCYSTFQCTRLEVCVWRSKRGIYVNRFYVHPQVPLDYSDASVGTADLAVIRLPANVSKSEYRGPLLFNPGGPGGSGVDTLVQAGPSLQLVFGSEYDIVSFDPRGVWVFISCDTISFPRCELLDASCSLLSDGC
jgi:hypothetical protein